MTAIQARKCFVHRRMTVQMDLKVGTQPLFSASLVPAVPRPPSAYVRSDRGIVQVPREGQR